MTEPGAPVKLSILMPVKCEGAQLPVILKILSAVVELPHEILVVYDDEDDDSIPAVHALQDRHPQVRLVHNRLGRGVANAIRAGVREAAGEYVLIFAVDDTGPALAIDDMLLLMDRGCDLVSCTRYARGGRRLGGSFIGGVLSWLANGLFQRLSGSVLSDGTTGIKMIRRSIFEQVSLEASVGWAVAFELAIKVQLAGFRVGEVPIISIDRLFGGQSTFRLGPWLMEYWKWFVWGLKEMRRAPGRARQVMTVADVMEPSDLTPVRHVPS